MKFVKFVHLLAVAIFIGSIPTHIVLGELAAHRVEISDIVALHDAKVDITHWLTTSGIIVALLSGASLLNQRRQLLKQNWMKVKMALVAIIVLNGIMALTPFAETLLSLAQTAQTNASVLGDEYAKTQQYEAIAGAINIAMILAVTALAVFRPRKKREN